nr:PREDICTED: uncharacterized protein LOC109037468 isoform X2 [Bemisia tabaci]
MCVMGLKYGKIGILLSLRAHTILGYLTLIARFQKHDCLPRGSNPKFQAHPISKRARKPERPLNNASFSMNLVREDFIEFEKTMNSELKTMYNTKDHPCDWNNLNSFKVFMGLSFCPMDDFWDIFWNQDTPKGPICHLLVPKSDNLVDKTGFVLNYGLCDTETGMQKMAEREIERMVFKDLGSDLQQKAPSVRRFYRIYIAFHGPKGVVKYFGPTELHPGG